MTVSPITGSGGLTIGSPNNTGVGAGTGTLTLTTPSGYTGGTVLGGGTLTVGSGSVLGSDTLTLINGTMQASGAASFTNAVTFNNSAVTLAGSNNLTFGGTTTR